MQYQTQRIANTKIQKGFFLCFYFGQKNKFYELTQKIDKFCRFLRYFKGLFILVEIERLNLHQKREKRLNFYNCICFSNEVKKRSCKIQKGYWFLMAETNNLQVEIKSNNLVSTLTTTYHDINDQLIQIEKDKRRLNPQKREVNRSSKRKRDWNKVEHTEEKERGFLVCCYWKSRGMIIRGICSSRLVVMDDQFQKKERRK